MLIQDGAKLSKRVFDDTTNVDLSSPALRGISTSASQKTVFVDYETWKAQAGMPILQANVYKVNIEQVLLLRTWCQASVYTPEDERVAQLNQKLLQFWTHLVIFLGIMCIWGSTKLRAKGCPNAWLVAKSDEWEKDGKRMNCGHCGV